ncbi:allantoinase AllB [Neobacillus jeddahensis]|uniref:allantoinase AllB n=1 Tax=Neobacillus jeddahensis TaxID=1461580 RepID=UPI00058BDA07|nr:allantoinase AllB [Neobacillus jeddahensis]
MTKVLWIKKGLVFIDDRFQEVDIKIIDGKIDSLHPSVAVPLQEKAATTIDASGCLVVPGFIDAHVHFNDPGRTDWEGMETGSRAAAKGGTTTIFDMPLNSSPSVTNVTTLREKKEYLSSLASVDYALWGGITETNLTNHSELEEMSSGIIAWKAFMSESGIADFPFVSPGGLEQAMQTAKDHHKILALHAEWEEEIARLTVQYQTAKGSEGRQAFLASRPISAEEKAVSHGLELAAKYGTAVHFVHISSARIIGLIDQAKKSGVNVTVETCPHYLLFDEIDFLEKGALLKCCPPLRPRSEVEGLWDCLKNGLIDTIGSDHSPCLYSMKLTPSIWEAWGGIQGVQFTWLALIDEALRRNIQLSEIVPLGTARVADRFGIADRKGRLLPGLDADVVLIRLDETTLATKESFAFRNQYSPYENKEFLLRVKKTILRGNVIFDDEENRIIEKYGREL